MEGGGGGGTAAFSSSSSNSMKFQRRCASRHSLKYSWNERRQSWQTNRRHKHRCVCLPDNCVPVQFPTVWSELRSNQQLCDGTIRCAGDRVFPVHRAILSAVSPYFKAVFTNNLNPSLEAEATRELHVSDVPGEDLSLILDYAYTGSCRVSTENVQRLLPLADRFEMLGVVQICCQFLLHELKPDNCLGIYKFAWHYFCRDLEKRGRRYIRQNFKAILQESAEFKELAWEELDEILRDDDLNVRSEELVFEAIKLWVESRDTVERSTHLPRLLDCVRYGHMRSQYFNENVLTWSLAQNQDCKDVVLPVAAYFKAKAYYSRHLDDELTRPRVPNEILFAIGGWNSGSPTNFVETYDNRANTWFLSPYTDHCSRAYHGVCTLNNLIYVIGGTDGKKHFFNTVSCFNPLTKEWREKACMHRARSYVSVCTYGGKIYALGGNNGLSRMNSCERYDPEANQWEMIAPMNWERSDASAASLNGCVYVVGGFDGYYILNSVEVYYVETNQWCELERMYVPRTAVSLVAFHDSLYAIGGFDGYDRLDSCEKYNPNQSDTWQKMQPMLTARSNFATAVLDDMIFVIGGYNGRVPISCVEYYDASSDQWYDASPMNLCRSAFSACVVADLANAREYSYHRHSSSVSWPKQQQQQQQQQQQSKSRAIECGPPIVG